MQILNNSELLKKYIDQYHLQDHVTGDLMKMAELVHFQAGEFIDREGGQNHYFSILIKVE